MEYLVPSPPRSVAPAPAFPGLGPGVHCSGHGLDLVANLGIIYTIVCSGLAAIPDQPELRGAASVFGVAGSAAPEQGHLAEDVGPPDQGEPEGATAHEEVLPDRGTVLEASKAAAFTVFEGPSSDESAEFWFFRGPVDISTEEATFEIPTTPVAPMDAIPSSPLSRQTLRGTQHLATQPRLLPRWRGLQRPVFLLMVLRMFLSTTLTVKKRLTWVPPAATAQAPSLQGVGGLRHLVLSESSSDSLLNSFGVPEGMELEATE